MAQITLQDVSGASPTTALTMMVADDPQTKLPRWREFRAPKIPPSQITQPLNFSLQDPLVDFTWAQDDWSRGGLATWAQPGSYFMADGVDLRWAGTAVLGPRNLGQQVSSAVGNRNSYYSFLVRNGGAEQATTGGWTFHANVTGTAATAAKKSGDYGFSLVTTGTTATGGSLMSQTLTNPTVYQNREITVSVYVNKVSGDTENLRIWIDDGTNIARGTAGGGAGSFAQITSTVTIVNNPPSITIRLENDAEVGPAATTYYVDDWAIVPTGGTTCVGFATLAGKLYGAFGRAICRWDNTNKVWDAVRLAASPGWTDIVEFNGNVFIGRGLSDAYEYSSDGTTWTSSNAVSPNAQYFAVARNLAGAYALWKNDAVASVKVSANPVNGGTAWSASALTVGSTDKVITKLHSAFDTIVVGKTNGLWVFNRWDPNNTAGDGLFYDAMAGSGYSTFDSTDNFKRSTYFNGWLWLTTRDGLLRWKPGQVEVLTNKVRPTSRPFSGAEPSRRPALLSSDTEQVWMVMEGKYTGTPSEAWLYSIKETGGELRVHPMQEIGAVAAPIPDAMTLTFVDGTYPEIFVAVRDNSSTNNAEQVGQTWRLPDFGGPPNNRLGAGIILNSTGYFDTAIWHGGMPDTPKAFISLTIIADNTSSSRTITVTYGLDGAPPTTTSLGVFNGSGRTQTLYFNGVTTPATNAQGTMIQFRFTFAGTYLAGSPELYAFGLHSTLRPAKLRTWEIWVRGEGFVERESGYVSRTSLPALITALNTLENQVYPVWLVEDLDNNKSDTSTAVHLVDVRREPAGEAGEEVYRLMLQEADVS